jgi:hypothetical protein
MNGEYAVNSGVTHSQVQGTVKCHFNERWGNEIFSKSKFVPGPHLLPIYLYVKMFHFNENHCNENNCLIQ